MNFYKIILGGSETEINNKFDNLDKYHQNQIDNFFETFEYVKYESFTGVNNIIYAILNDYQKQKLEDIFITLGVSSYFIDISDKVIKNEFYYIGSVPDEILEYQLVLMVESFQEQNLDMDSILDKINEKGINSLTELDKKILSQVC